MSSFKTDYGSEIYFFTVQQLHKCLCKLECIVLREGVYDKDLVGFNCNCLSYFTTAKISCTSNVLYCYAYKCIKRSRYEESMGLVGYFRTSNLCIAFLCTFVVTL